MKIIETNRQGVIVQFTKNELFELRKKEMKEIKIIKKLMIIFWAFLLLFFFMFMFTKPKMPNDPCNIYGSVVGGVGFSAFILAIIFTIRYLVKRRRFKKEIDKAYSGGGLEKNSNSES